MHTMLSGVGLRSLLSMCLLVCLFAAALAADITGSARNQTLGQPAAGDEVVLVRLDARLDRGMQRRGTPPGTQEEARTRTNAEGAFTFHVQHPGQPYLVRVVHRGVTYNQQASGGDHISIQVFDAAPRLRAISGSIEILRVGTRAGANQHFLHVSDMYEIRNESSPPMTQAGARTFEVYLPANAKMDSVLAAAPGSGPSPSPGKIGVMISAARVPGEPGHYTVNFPLRPGATKFAFNYDVRYPGHAAFHTRHAYPLQQFAVMIPPTMKFSSASSAFQALKTGDKEYQVRAAIHLKAGEGPAFEISGNGPLPSLGDQASADQAKADQAEVQMRPQGSPLSNATVSGSGGTVPPSSARPDSALEKASSSWPWPVLMGGVVLAGGLVVSAVIVLRARKPRVDSSRRAALQRASQGSATFLETLKEELFQLEVERIRESISAEEYASARQALEKTVKRAIARASQDSSASQDFESRGAKPSATRRPVISATARRTG